MLRETRKIDATEISLGVTGLRGGLSRGMFGRMMFYKVERRHLGIRVFVAGLAAAAVVLAGCNSSPRPHLRLGCCPTSTPGTRFLKPGKLGRHSYGYGWRENNGIVYTCRGGHIDIAHVRTAADQTRYLAEKSYAHLMRGDAQFCFKLRVEPSKYFVTIRYP